MFGESASAGGVFGGSLGEVLPGDVHQRFPEGFEDLPGYRAPMQAAAGMGQMPPGAPTRRAVRGPGGHLMQAQAGPMPLAQNSGPSKGGLVAAFLGGVLVMGVGYGVYRHLKG